MKGGNRLVLWEKSDEIGDDTVWEKYTKNYVDFLEFLNEEIFCTNI